MRSQDCESRLAVRMARIPLLDEELRADVLSASIARALFVFHHDAGISEQEVYSRASARTSWLGRRW